MNLREYERMIVDTTREDWNVITCWGFGSGPSYLERASGVTVSLSPPVVEVESHSMRAALKADLAIWLAWGFPINPDFKEPWANKFSDPNASSALIDFFYGSNLVYRDVYVSVDGARCMLPLPEREFDLETRNVRRYTVPANKHRFFSLLDGLESLSDFDMYFRQAGFETVDLPWMV